MLNPPLTTDAICLKTKTFCAFSQVFPFTRTRIKNANFSERYVCGILILKMGSDVFETASMSLTM